MKVSVEESSNVLLKQEGLRLTELADSILMLVLSRVPLESQQKLMRTCRRLKETLSSRGFRLVRVATGWGERAIVRIGRPCFVLIDGVWREFPTPKVVPLFAACAVASAPAGDALVLVGGLSPWVNKDRGDRELLSQVVAYTPGRGWSRLPDLLSPRGFVQAEALADGRVVAFGGATNNRFSKSRDAMSLAIDAPHTTWSPLPRLPRPVSQVATGVLGSTLFAAGGGSDRLQRLGCLDVLQVFDGESWTVRAPMPHPRRAAKGAVCRGRFYVVAGLDPMGRHTNTVFIYDPQTDRWEESCPLPRHHLQGKYRGELVAHDDRLYFFPTPDNCYDDKGVYHRPKWKQPLIFLERTKTWTPLPLTTTAPPAWAAHTWNETEVYASLLLG
ncbi:hypothetical protein CTAYLR_002423 [Chrysophaeum taylorii]|uniref:Uncharacterized protein n=1 Tax=Chrysophaeum taylorii TaxID=2483200 RepID=A0AAD7XMK3_9STRA|nr:hypothetical protein CTAYLR_002423 [Chrysophaeum taylorii]